MDYNKTTSDIQSEMLKEISDSYEKSKGYFLWDIFKAISVRVKDIMQLINNVSERLDVEQLSGDELERFIYQRTGIKRKKATYSTGILTVMGNGIVKAGSFFETEGMTRFRAVEEIKISGIGSVEIQATVAGSSGNVSVGSIKKMPVTIEGIASCENTVATINGFEAEMDTDLLGRYYDKLQEPATSGNVYHYMRWAKEVHGVADARVLPLWNGSNTVKIVVINQDREPASDELVKAVQEYIDPNSEGAGKGQAPIGAFCTVESAVAKRVNISVKVVVIEGSDLKTAMENITKNLKIYFTSIAFKQNHASYAKIGSTILDSDGVMDYENLIINGNVHNVTCTDTEVMQLGGVTLEE